MKGYTEETKPMTAKTNKTWKVKASDLAMNTFNPIRNILENLKLSPHPDKPMISLSIGDPTVFDNLKPHPITTQSLIDAVKTQKNNGYGPSFGLLLARNAVAKHVSVENAEVTGADIILTSGCSSALDISISALANPGQNILIPKPGFPLYATLAVGLGIEVKEYNLVPERGWEVDLDHLDSLVDENTAAIVVNNPSNPCGSVFSESHLRQILAVAEAHCLPIIADEIYEQFVFPGNEYVPIASLTTTVPILSCSGVTKRFIVPGWRLGWIVVYDRNNIFEGGVRKGLTNLTTRIIGPNTAVQAALPSILRNTPQSFFDETIDVVRNNAELAFKHLSRVPGLKPVMPSGAMYMMVGIDRELFPDFSSDLEIVERLVTEQSVFCLPGKCFSLPDYVRLVMTVPDYLMTEACERIEEFCLQHVKVKAALPLLPAPPMRLMSDGSADGSSSSNTDDEYVHEIHLPNNATRKQTTATDFVKPDKSTYTRKTDTPTRLA